MNFEYFFIAIGNLRRRKLRSWLTMVGIFIGIASVVTLISLGEGLRSVINAQFGFLGTDVLSVTPSMGFGPPGSSGADPLTSRDIDEISRVSGVRGVAGRILVPIKIDFNRNVGFSYAASIPDGDERAIIERITNLKADKGRLLNDGDSGFIFVGSFFDSDDNGFDRPISVGSRVEINDKPFRVVGVLDPKGSFQLDRTVFMNEDDLRSLVNRKSGEYDIIGVFFDENADVRRIQEDIERRLRRVRNVRVGEEDFSVQTPASTLENVNSILNGIQLFVFIIAGISILVGGIGIMNTMYTAVVERTKEIGVMKSIGAKNSDIFSIFFIESGFIGSIGGLIGVVFGVVFGYFIAFVGRLVLGSSLISVYFPFWLIFGSLFGSFVLGSFFGSLPAYQASKLNPVDALRRAK